MKPGSITRWPDSPPVVEPAADLPSLPDINAYTVYRCYDAAGVLLYVGCTSEFRRRMRHHRRSEQSQRWLPRVDHIKTVTYSDELEAQIAERVAIQRGKPVYNVRHNGSAA